MLQWSGSFRSFKDYQRFCAHYTNVFQVFHERWHDLSKYYHQNDFCWSVEWANTFIGMTEQCVLINTHTLQHQIENDSGHIGRSVHVWRDYLLLYMNYAELHVYRVHTRSIWDGEHETRQLAVKSAYPAFKVHEGTMFLSHITISKI